VANYSSTNRPAYVWDATNSVWVPIGTGPHTHSVADVANAVVTGGGSVIQPGNANVKGLAIAGATSQTANLQEWQTSGFTPVAYVDPSGNFSTTGSITSNNNYYAGKNFALNGGFDVWQRGTSFSLAGYGPDKWFTFANDTMSRQAFTAASPEIPNGLYYLRYTNVQTGAYHYIENRIENGHNDLSGKTVTISFWARSNTSNSFTLSVLTALNNDTQLLSAGFPITPTWTKFYATFNLPTLNYAATYRYLRIGGAPELAGWDIAQVQYEIGSFPTQFTRTGGTLDAETKACQRFYYQTPTYATASYSAYNSGNMVSTPFFFPTRMRIAPTVTVADSAGTANKISIYPGGGSKADNITPAATTTVTTDYWYYLAGGTSSGSQGSSGLIGLYYYATADI
jgi:hypothetical protein